MTKETQCIHISGTILHAESLSGNILYAELEMDGCFCPLNQLTYPCNILLFSALCMSTKNKTDSSFSKMKCNIETTTRYKNKILERKKKKAM